MIPVYQPYLTGKEKEYVASCFELTWISSRGEFVSKFEAEFEKFVGVRDATTVCNGTIALHLAMMLLGLRPGDEVIVPTLTYVASVNTIVQAGATPRLWIPLNSTWQIGPEGRPAQDHAEDQGGDGGSSLWCAMRHDFPGSAL